jgi:stearoyl-CoA desaturase (Delta-9 desaturase)
MGGLPVPLQVVPKPNRTAQRFYEGTKPVLFTKNIFAKEKTTETVRTKNFTDKVYIGFIISMHLLCLAAPFTFSWSNLALFGATYFITGCLGITLSFHRQLAHKSFRTPKWLEYFLAYCGALAVQGDPKEWVSTHRCAAGTTVANVES